MSKINISLNGSNYPIDTEVLAQVKTDIAQHLSSSMSGSGATIKLGDTTYNIDSTKLSTARTDFVDHLGTISGEGASVLVMVLNTLLILLNFLKLLLSYHKVFIS